MNVPISNESTVTTFERFTSAESCVVDATLATLFAGVRLATTLQLCTVEGAGLAEPGREFVEADDIVPERIQVARRRARVACRDIRTPGG